jgi:hypothetical protein
LGCTPPVPSPEKGRGLTFGFTPHLIKKKTAITETTSTPTYNNMVGDKSFHADRMKQAGESLQDVNVPRTLSTTEKTTRIETWNIFTLYETRRTLVC